MVDIQNNHDLFETLDGSGDPAWSRFQWFSKLGERGFSRYMQRTAELESPSRVRLFIHYAAWLKSGKSFQKSEVEKAKNEILAEARGPENFLTGICRPEDYKTIQQFFTRKLKDGARPFPENPKIPASPADGKIANFGKINIREIKNIKGETMDFAALARLSAKEQVQFDGGSFLDIYLAPFDYHGYESPYPGKIALKELIVIGGRERSVSGNKRQILERNVRVVAKFQDGENRPFIMVFVAALGVARIKLFGHIFESSKRLNAIQKYAVDDFYQLFGKSEVTLQRGENIGHFLLGSTLVLLAPKGGIQFDALKKGQSVKVGQAIGSEA